MKHLTIALAAVALLSVVSVVSQAAAQGELRHTIFVNSIESGIDPSQSFPPPYPNFGGIDAADWIVTFQAWSAGLFTEWDGDDLVFRAILSTPSEHAVDRLPISGAIYGTAGELIATSQSDLWDGNLENGVIHDEWGNPVPALAPIWTATSEDGTHQGPGCGAWNENTGDGVVGLAGEDSFSWIDGSLLSCSSAGRLYALSPPRDMLTGEFLPWGTPPNFELGDVNRDGMVNLLDVDAFIAVLISGDYQYEADCNEDGVVNLLDVDFFIAILGGG